MKTALILVSLCLFLSLGALGLYLVSGRTGAPVEAAEVSLSPAPAATPQGNEGAAGRDEILARLDALGREVGDLRTQIASLQAGAAREPVAEAGDASRRAEPIDESSSAFAAEHRDAILRVIEEDRAEQKRKQDEEQRARDLQTALARAERTAKQFGLAQDQQKALADVYILEREKMEGLRAQMRDPFAAGNDPEALRQSFRDVRDWRLNELTNRFGPELAEKINDADFERFRGGFGGGGRRGSRGEGGADGERPAGGF